VNRLYQPEIGSISVIVLKVFCETRCVSALTRQAHFPCSSIAKLQKNLEISKFSAVKKELYRKMNKCIPYTINGVLFDR
jgi:hypothetical protein